MHSTVLELAWKDGSKPTENLRQDSQFTERGCKSGPAEYKAGVQARAVIDHNGKS
jgi:hypothetical protein